MGMEVLYLPLFQTPFGDDQKIPVPAPCHHKQLLRFHTGGVIRPMAGNGFPPVPDLVAVAVQFDFAGFAQQFLGIKTCFPLLADPMGQQKPLIKNR